MSSRRGVKAVVDKYVYVLRLKVETAESSAERSPCSIRASEPASTSVSSRHWGYLDALVALFSGLFFDLGVRRRRQRGLPQNSRGLNFVYNRPRALSLSESSKAMYIQQMEQNVEAATSACGHFFF